MSELGHPDFIRLSLDEALLVYSMSPSDLYLWAGLTKSPGVCGQQHSESTCSSNIRVMYKAGTVGFLKKGGVV